MSRQDFPLVQLNSGHSHLGSRTQQDAAGGALRVRVDVHLDDTIIDGFSDILMLDRQS